MTKNKPAIGIDVGRYHIHLVILAREGKSFKLMDFASLDLNPEQGREEKVRNLQKLLEQKQLSGSKVNIGVSGESVIVRYIDLPNMKDEEISQALEYEAQQYIPFKMEEVIFDYHILKRGGPNNKVKILLVAAKKEAIIQFIQFIEQSNLIVNLIEVDAFSLINCFQANGPKIKPENVSALVNLEYDLVNMNILQGEVPYFTRDISLIEEDGLSLWREKSKPGELFERIRPFLENLIRELRLSLDYFENEFGKPVQNIYLSGQGAGLSQMVECFSTQLGRAVSLWNPMQNLVIDSSAVDNQLLKRSAPMLAIACGLALRGAE